ncbi:MAG: hypothetical protein WBW33_23920 [Bryobacteraceae bacterium]
MHFDRHEPKWLKARERLLNADVPQMRIAHALGDMASGGYVSSGGDVYGGIPQKPGSASARFVSGFAGFPKGWDSETLISAAELRDGASRSRRVPDSGKQDSS